MTKYSIGIGIFAITLSVFACKNEIKQEGKQEIVPKNAITDLSKISPVDCKDCAFVSDSVKIGSTIGCGDFFVSKVISKDLVVGVAINPEKIKFSTSFQTFDATKNNIAEVSLTQCCNLNSFFRELCNDARYLEDCKTRTWKLTKGEIDFKVSEVFNGKYRNCETPYYTTTVLLKNAIFQLENSDEIIYLENIEIKDVHVGWCAG